jgi:hypothetical protein
MDYLIKNELLAKEQHGFMKGRNCTTNLLEYLDILTDAINKGILINVLYTDFKNAFDSVALKKLCLKLRQIGIQGQLLRWIESFLSNRKQRKVTGNSKTEWVDVVSGVVQGSVLGPIIFLLFISDQQVFQNDIKRLDEWSEKWKLGLNFEKCKITTNQITTNTIIT